MKELTQISRFSPKAYAEDCVLIGARSIDPEEAVTFKNSGIRVVTMRELDERGMSAVMDEAMWWALRHTVGFHVSMDMDFVDPYYAPGVGTPVQGGPTYRESHLAMEKIADSGKLLSFELAEVNPVLDNANRNRGAGRPADLIGVRKKDYVKRSKEQNVCSVICGISRTLVG